MNYYEKTAIKHSLDNYCKTCAESWKAGSVIFKR